MNEQTCPKLHSAVSIRECKHELIVFTKLRALDLPLPSNSVFEDVADTLVSCSGLRGFLHNFILEVLWRAADIGLDCVVCNPVDRFPSGLVGHELFPVNWQVNAGMCMATGQVAFLQSRRFLSGIMSRSTNKNWDVGRTHLLIILSFVGDLLASRGWKVQARIYILLYSYSISVLSLAQNRQN